MKNVILWTLTGRRTDRQAFLTFDVDGSIMMMRKIEANDEPEAKSDCVHVELLIEKHKQIDIKCLCFELSKNTSK